MPSKENKVNRKLEILETLPSTEQWREILTDLVENRLTGYTVEYTPSKDNKISVKLENLPRTEQVLAELADRGVNSLTGYMELENKMQTILDIRFVLTIP